MRLGQVWCGDVGCGNLRSGPVVYCRVWCGEVRCVKARSGALR